MIVVPAGTYVLSTQLGGLTVNGGQRVTFSGAGANSTVIVPQTGGSFRLLRDQRRRAGRDLRT